MEYLHFEARDVPPYGEPVSSSDLQIGQVYFFLTHEDESGLCPALRPVVFLGRDLEFAVTGKVYFQDLASYAAGERFPLVLQSEPGQSRLRSLSSNTAEIFFGSDRETAHVFEFEKALNLLLLCSLRRATPR